MLFSFVIPTINDIKVKNTIQSIFFSKGWDFDDCEVIVVVNNCSESFCRLLSKEFSNQKKGKTIKLLFLEKATISSARNAGIKNARGKYIVHIDSDCKIARDYLENLRRHVNERRFIIGRGTVKFIPTKNLLSRANCQLKTLAYFSRRNICYTPNLIVNYSAYQKVGLFDEKVFHGEDTEWSLRSKRFKIEPIFLNDLVVEHFDPENIFKILKNYFYYGAARVYRFKKIFKKEKQEGMWGSLNFFWRLFNEIPNLKDIRPFLYKPLIIFLYFIRDIGIIYGLFRWRTLE